jgi:DNA-binding beta-propeller fold protein YncE
MRLLLHRGAVCVLLAGLLRVGAASQETTPDGVLLKNAVNTPDHPYRPAGSSDPRFDNPRVAHGFGPQDRRLVYVALPGGTSGGQVLPQAAGIGIVVLDLDPGESLATARELLTATPPSLLFIKRIHTWDVAASTSPEEVSGIAASPATNMIYIATRGRLAAFDLANDKNVWEQTYGGNCCERPEVTPDGKTLIVGSDLKDFWYVIDAATGELTGKIQAPASNMAHNMALSADGKTVFMAPNGVTMTVGDVPTMKAIKTITFSDHVRPFVINHDATRVYANLNNLLGFEIADVKSGKVIKRIEAPAEMWKEKWANPNLHFFGHACPSHGIGLTPDESEIWIVDDINYQVLVYDNTGEWPALKLTFKTTASADWITMGLDGQYAFLSSGDVVDVKTHTIVGQMKDEYGRTMHSEKVLEMAFSNGKLQRTVSQFAEGIPSAVQPRLAAARLGGTQSAVK